MLDYPDKALQNCIEGKVYVSFVVERDGLITNVHTVRGIGGGCDEEAERVVRSMPRWLPGSYKNEPVRVRYTLPMNFRITDKQTLHDPRDRPFQERYQFPKHIDHQPLFQFLLFYLVHWIFVAKKAQIAKKRKI
jgi:TonB family protein